MEKIKKLDFLNYMTFLNKSSRFIIRPYFFQFYGIILFVCCLFISQIVKGESHPSSNFLSRKSESESSILSTSPWESLPGEKGRESIITLNNSFSSSQIYDLVDETERTKVNSEARRKRGFFDKAQEKQRIAEEYDRSFRLFWFLGGVAIVFFICIFILTLLCFCCPSVTNKTGKVTSIPRISATGVEPDLDGSVVFESFINQMEMGNRSRSPSVFSTNALYVPHYRLSQEQVNAIQIASQSRRGSALPSTSQGLMPPSALIDVNVIQEQRPDTVTDKILTT